MGGRAARRIGAVAAALCGVVLATLFATIPPPGAGAADLPEAPAGLLPEPQPGPRAARAACPEDLRALGPGETSGARLAALVAAAAPGAAFCLGAGLHRIEPVTPKDDQRFYGLVGATLSGARPVEGFVRDGGAWSAAVGLRPRERRKAEFCLPGFPRCDDPIAAFLDDRPLIQTAERADVAPGRFHVDDVAGRLTLGDDPTGRAVEITAAPYAFIGGAERVRIEGLTIERFAPPIQFGAVGASHASRGWSVIGSVLRQNYGVGLVVGPGSVVRGNSIVENGQMGFGCNGADILVEGNEIRANGFFAGLDPLWEGGGAKCSETDGLVVRANRLIGNNGFGFWTDIDNIRTTYADNLFAENRGGGVSHEISYAAAIRGNAFVANGARAPHWLWGCAIQVQDSQGVEARDNLIDLRAAGQGVCLIQQDRGPGAFGPYRTVANLVAENLVLMGPGVEGRSGAIADHDLAGMAAGGNRFERNHYVAPDAAAARWAWITDFYDWATYRARSGQDADSVLELGAPDAALEARILRRLEESVAATGVAAVSMAEGGRP